MIDTNVAVVANRREYNVSSACVKACVRALLRLRETGILVIDDDDEVLAEYRSHLNLSGQPGVGDSFIKWAYNNIARSDLVSRVSIPRRAAGSDEYLHFPEDPALAGFDRSDREFVAISIAHGGSPPILNATDSDWLDYVRPLARHGVRVEQLCPERFGAA